MKKILPIFALIFLFGCAAKNNLYSWGQYEGSIYQYFNNESPEEQITLLEENLVLAKQEGKPLPPGFYAHLGLLYGEVGQDEKMYVMLDKEASEFPESANFIKNLKTNFRSLNQ